MTKEYAIESILFEDCPICHKGKVNNLISKGLLIKSSKIECDNCKALFKQKDMKEEELTYQLDLSNSQEHSKYNGKTLKKSEWIRGKTDIETVIESNELPNYIIEGLRVILQPNETTHYYASTKLYEDRAVRQHIWGGVRIMKGVYVGKGQSESHGELREIDIGNLILTNQRLIFDGYKRKIEYKLDKIISITKYSNGVQIGSTNRKKSQIYIVDEPEKLATYVEIGINLFKKQKTLPKKTTKTTHKEDREGEAIKILKIRYAKGEITKKEFEDMKKDLKKVYD